MKNIAVVYGGTSCEKDISVITGMQAIKAIEKREYNVYPVFWSENGKFYLPDKYGDIEAYSKSEYIDGKEVMFCHKNLCLLKKNKIKAISQIDCVLLCTHGGKGENGSIQGYFEIEDIPYTSPDVIASGIGMDKGISKIFCKKISLPVLPYVVLSKEDKEENLIKSVSKLSFPLIVKPCRQGSSIGINICDNMDMLKDAVEIAFEYDDKIMIEKALKDFREINCACMRINNEILPSSLEEPIGWKEFLSFEDKYMSHGKNMKVSSRRNFPAKLDSVIEQKIKNMTTKLYKALNLKGIVRCDYLLDKKSGEVYFNEINTIPGSLAGYLYEDKNLNLSKIIGIMIEYAIAENKEKTQPRFSSGVLQYYAKKGSNACKMPIKKV